MSRHYVLHYTRNCDRTKEKQEEVLETCRLSNTCSSSSDKQQPSCSCGDKALCLSLEQETPQYLGHETHAYSGKSMHVHGM